MKQAKNVNRCEGSDRVKITVVCVGKIKEKFFTMAIDEYRKRLGRYCKLEIIEVADEKTPDNASENMEDKIKETEAERILKNIREDTYVITLEINGKMKDSVELSGDMQKLFVNGVSNIIFVIGGSLGLHKSVSARADEKLSFSKMTFPHQLMRVILLEQIYRAFRIMNGEPYHK